MNEPTATARTFREVYDGWHSGLVQWSDWEALMARVAAEPSGWFVYDTGGPPPSEEEAAERLPVRLAEIDRYLRHNHRADYCGFVYADARHAPSMIKVYNPRNASACGAATAPLPAYVLSRMPPDELPFAEPEAVRPGLFSRLVKGTR
jgi:hypothetical protein